MNPALLPVRPHLHPRPRRDPLAAVPPGIRAKLSAAFTDALGRVPLLERVDRDRHSKVWGYDLVRSVPLELAEALPWAGEA